jgi:hypothetical protein
MTLEQSLNSGIQIHQRWAFFCERALSFAQTADFALVLANQILYVPWMLAMQEKLYRGQHTFS